MKNTIRPRSSISEIRRRTATAALALAVLLLPTVAATRSAQAQTFSVLYNFTGTPDGATPLNLIQDTAGNLYGMTGSGGSSDFGTVFKLDTNGAETVLYSFKGMPDGAYPFGGLAQDAAGNLYGTTSSGGTSNFGTVFRLDANNTETVLYSFKGTPDGQSPTAGVVLDTAGNLYGTTGVPGGLFSAGIVFKLDTSGAETVLHNFTGAMTPPDGWNPNGGLVLDASGNLYGTTTGGGTGRGTIFKVDPSGTETVLYVFTSQSLPAGLVRDTSGNLFGTVQQANVFSASCPRARQPEGPCGGVFKLDTAGNLTVLYDFTGSPDGAAPAGPLVRDAAGTLYGTTVNGGDTSPSVCYPFGCGVMFKLDSSGTETVLHTFTAGTDGMSPQTGVIVDAAGTLYGSSAGGASGFGDVIKLVPPGFSLAASAFTPTTISPGGSSTSTVNVAAVAGFSGSVALTCSVQPMPALAPTCSASPNPATTGTTTTLAVRTTPASAHAAVATSGPFYAVWMPLLGLALASARSRSGGKKKGRIPTAVLTCMLSAGMAFAVACGGGGSNTVIQSGGTPSGAYTMTVTGTSAGAVQQSTSTMLTVQ